MSKGVVGMIIPRIERVITNRVSFYVLLIRNKIFLESSHRIETHLDVVVEVLGVQSSVAFELCLDEDFIEFW